MLSLVLFNLPVVAAALLIGVATGRWLFRQRSGPTDKGEDK